MSKVWDSITNTGSSILVYLSTLVGVLLSQYAPLLLAHGNVDSAFSWIKLAISAGVAFYLVAGQENGGDPIGKDKNFKRRIANALSHGVAWNAIIGIAGQAAGQ